MIITLWDRHSGIWAQHMMGIRFVVQADVARAIKEECEGELAVALPILEDALAALDTIKEADITYIRKLGNPPAAIKLVMEVCHLYIARHPPWCLLGLPDRLPIKRSCLS